MKFNSYKINIYSNQLLCMCSIVKEENLYIKEFIQHYKLLGYNRFYLYDNNDNNGEKLEDVISEEINSGLASIINFRNYRGGNGGQQMAAYYNCYENNNNNCNWISFFDIDEYLILDSKFISLQQLLNNKRYQNCEGILINWKIYHDNNNLEYKNISIKQRFTEVKKNFRDKISKSIVRGKLSKNLNRTYSAHSLWNNIKYCNTLGKNISYRLSLNPPSFSYAHLNHYYTKSISEFCKKIKKGNVYYNITLTPQVLQKKFNIFFAINNKTSKKVKIFNSFFNTSFKLI